MAITSEMKNTKTAPKVKGQGQLPTTLAFTVKHIPTKLHQFPTNSFREFLQTERQTDRETNRQTDATKDNTTDNNKCDKYCVSWNETQRYKATI